MVLVLALNGDPLAWLSEQVKNRNYILSAIQNLESLVN